MFRCERETTLFGIQKRTRLEISVQLYLQHCPEQNTNIGACAARYTQDCVLNRDE